jgi:hypothetical protein
MRLACVVLISAALALLARHTGRIAGWLAVLAGETLFLYVFHVLLVYGDGFGLGDRIGRSLSPWAACGVAALVVSGSALAALGYHRLRLALRRARRPEARLARSGQTR